MWSCRIGGGGGASVFGSRGAVGFLGKLTAWLAALFMVIALVLARLSLEGSAVVPLAEGQAASLLPPHLPKHSPCSRISREHSRLARRLTVQR